MARVEGAGLAMRVEPTVEDALKLIERSESLRKPVNVVRESGGQLGVQARISLFEPGDQPGRVVGPADLAQNVPDPPSVTVRRRAPSRTNPRQLNPRLKCLRGRPSCQIQPFPHLPAPASVGPATKATKATKILTQPRTSVALVASVAPCRLPANQRSEGRPPVWSNVLRATPCSTNRPRARSTSPAVLCRPKRSRMSVLDSPFELARRALRISSAMGSPRLSPNTYRTEASEYSQTAKAARRWSARINAEQSSNA